MRNFTSELSFVHSSTFGEGDLIGSMNEPIKMSERNLNVVINAKDISMYYVKVISQ